MDASAWNKTSWPLPCHPAMNCGASASWRSDVSIALIDEGGSVFVEGGVYELLSVADKP